MRKNQKLLDANKGMNDYDWERLYQERKLKRLNVSLLDVYIREKNMKVPKGMLKKGKLELVTADIARSAIKRLATAEIWWREGRYVVLQQIGDTDNDGECDSSSDGDDDLEKKESDSDDSSGDDIALL